MQKLNDIEIQTLLDGQTGWDVKDNHLIKDFGFKGFSTAIEFVNSLVPVAEKLNHHPKMTISYNRVTISLISHSAKGLTKCDFKFANQADEVADQLRR